MYEKRIEVVMAVLLLVGAYFFAREGAHMVENMRAQKGEVCIVIDAGHGDMGSASSNPFPWEGSHHKKACLQYFIDGKPLGADILY